MEQAEKNPLSGDYGLVLKSKAKHAAVSSRFNKPFTFDKEPLIIQYEINYQVNASLLVSKFNATNLVTRSKYNVSSIVLLFIFRMVKNVEEVISNC